LEQPVGRAAAYVTSIAVQAATLVSGSADIDDNQEVTDALDVIRETHWKTFLARAFGVDVSEDCVATFDAVMLSQLSFTPKWFKCWATGGWWRVEEWNSPRWEGWGNPQVVQTKCKWI
jgi:hypothetical protein